MMKKRNTAQKESTNVLSTKPNKKSLFLIGAISFCTVAAIVIPLIITTTKTKNNELVELTDKSLLPVIQKMYSKNDASIMIAPSLNEVWEESNNYKNEEAKIDTYFCEFNLKSESYFTCYYLHKNTIKKIEKYVNENFSYYMSDFDGEIYYLYYYVDLLANNKLSENDKLFFKKIKIDESKIQKEIGDYCLQKITRNINISNDNFGKLFIENIEYNNNNFVIEPKIGYLISNKFDCKKVLFNNVSYMKSLFTNGIYDAGFLDIFAYLINDDETFDTYVYYDNFILEKDPNYYNELKNIIITENFISKSQYTDSDNNVHKLDNYKVLCDYNKAKLLFNIE